MFELPVTTALANDEQPFTGLVTTTVYVPAAAATGFCNKDVKPFGPVHT